MAAPIANFDAKSAMLFAASMLLAMRLARRLKIRKTSRLAVTADYDFYRLCRVDGEFTWNSIGGVTYETLVGLLEVLN